MLGIRTTVLLLVVALAVIGNADATEKGGVEGMHAPPEMKDVLRNLPREIGKFGQLHPLPAPSVLRRISGEEAPRKPAR